MNGNSLYHPSAEVSHGATVGSGTRIWQHCIVLSGAVIGADCKLAHNVFVETNVRIGNRVTIKDNVTVYNGVSIQDDVFIGPNVVFTNVRNPRAFISRKDAFEDTVIFKGASIGANATIVCGVTVSAYALVGAGAVVTRNVPAHAIVVGNPAHPVGWVGRSGEKLDENLICPETGERYGPSSKGGLRQFNS